MHPVDVAGRAAYRRSREQLLAELNLLRYLGRHGILTPQPVALRDGADVRMIAAPEGPRHTVLFTFVPGVPFSATIADSYRYGQAVARFHAMADGYSPDETFWRFEAAEMIDQPLDLLRPWFAVPSGRSARSAPHRPGRSCCAPTDGGRRRQSGPD